MAQQIKKKFIGQDQIDGSKIKLLQGQSIRGTNSLGQEVDLVKIGSQDKIEVLGQEVALKSALDQESSDRQSGDAATLASAQSYADQKVADLVNSAPEVLDTLKELSDALGGDANFATTIAGQIGAVDDKVDAEIARAEAAESELDGRLDTLEPKVSTLESEMDMVEQSVQAEQSRATQAEQELDSRLDTLEPKVSTLESEMDLVEQSVQAEQTARIAADAALQAQINALDSGFVTEAELDAAVSDLESQINDVDGYAQDIRSDLDDLDGYAQDIRSDLDQEVLDRQSGDSALQTGLNSEVSRAQAAELAEQTARIAADSQLQSALNQEISDRQADVNAEESRAIAEESRIEGKVDQEISDRVAAVLEERSDRLSADQDLQGQVDIEKGRIDAILSASQADKDSFAEIVQLINSIDTENDSAFASYVLSNNEALATEVSNRESADEDLQTSIDGLQSAMDQEVQDRESADEQLQTNIDGKVSKAGDTMAGAYSLQGNLTINAGTAQNLIGAMYIDFSDSQYPDNHTMYGADNIEMQTSDEDQSSTTTVFPGYLTVSRLDKATGESFSVNIEEGKLSLIRSDGLVTNDPFMPTQDKHAATKKYVDQQDSALSARISAIEAQIDGPLFEKQKFIIDEASELSSVELSHECIENSLVVCVGRLMAHKDEDYSVSVVDGKTVLTWMGDFAQGGSEGIESGDVIFVTFARGM